MRWKPKAKKVEKDDGWFAWYPVKLHDTNEWVWLEKVWEWYYLGDGLVFYSVFYYSTKKERDIARGY